MWRITPDSSVVELTGADGGAGAAVSGIVWVASDTLSFADCQMPAGRKMLRQMVPFTLEDRVVDPIEKLHFATGDLHDGAVPVAVVSRKRMDAWLQLIEDEAVDARMILPDIYALPFTQGRVTLWHEGDRCLLRNGPHSGFAGNLDWVSVIAGLESYTSRLDVFSDNVDALPQEWRTSARPLLAPLEQMMARFEGGEVIDLLQGDYAPASPVAGWLRPWRAAAAFALVALLAHTGGLVIEARMLDAQADEMRRSTASLLATIEDSDDVGNLRRLVSRRLQRLREHRNKSEGSLWSLLPALDRVISRCANCRVESLELSSQLVQIDIRAGANLERVKENMLGAGGSFEATHSVVAERDNYTLLRFEFRMPS